MGHEQLLDVIERFKGKGTDIDEQTTEKVEDVCGLIELALKAIATKGWRDVERGQVTVKDSYKLGLSGSQTYKISAAGATPATIALSVSTHEPRSPRSTRSASSARKLQRSPLPRLA